MKPVLLVVCAFLMLRQLPCAAATNELSSLETNFVSGAELSLRDLDLVVKLGNLCGIESVTAVRTKRGLSGASILISGDEKVDGRRLTFKTLVARREGWPGGDRKGIPAKSAGVFWIGLPARPDMDERTIVRVGNRTFRVGLSNGIKPAGADQIIEAFVTGRIVYSSDSAKQMASGLDFSQPSWLGISGPHPWITFSKPGPLTRVQFSIKGKEVTILDIIRMYE